VSGSNAIIPVKKVIRPYECSLIAADGPRLQGRWHLEGLQIPYDSQFTGIMALDPDTKDMPIMYGHLGTDITFLAVRVVYGSQLQLSTSRADSIIADKYIEWYYEDEPLVKYTMTDLLVLTGNDNHRIKQIYVCNPTDYVAEMHIMAANLKKNVISSQLLPTQNTFTGLYYSSILSDQVNFTPITTGSTQIEIYNDSDNLILSLEYASIDVIENECEKLIIRTDNDENIELVFLSEFHAKQAHSRISWVTEDYVNRYLTSEEPGIDNVAPIVYFYANPVDTYTGSTVTVEQLQETFINYIEDARDGEISKYDTEVTIRKVGSIRNFEQIEEQGTYEVSFTISDIAGNEVTHIKTVYMYANAPTIKFRDSSTSNIMYINDTNYYKTEYDANIIDETDVRNYYIECVEDYVDGTIPKSAVTVDIIQITGSTGGLTTSGITLVGQYQVTFTVENSGGLETTEVRTFYVYTNNFIKPWVVWKPGYEDGDFTVASGLTETQFRDLTISGITNTDYDTTISVDDIVLSGNIVFPTQVIGTEYSVTYSITNYSGFENDNQPYRTKSVDVDEVISFPEFVFHGWTGNTNIATLTAITSDWLIDFYVSAVTDLNDGNIPLSEVTCEIRQGTNTLSAITSDGNYTLVFSVENSQENETVEGKPLIVDSIFDGGNAFGPFNFTLYGGNAFLP
jgi:hypothetical protein